MDFSGYRRFFILLEEQNKGFAYKQNDEMQGYIKIETADKKGSMRIGVRNIKPYDRNRYIYKLILFGKGEEGTIHHVMGTIILNKSGNGETYFRFNPQNVDDRGNPLINYHMVIVAALAVRDGKEPLHPVLKGFFPPVDEGRGRGTTTGVSAAGGIKDETAGEGKPFGDTAGQERAAAEAEPKERSFNLACSEKCVKGEGHLAAESAVGLERERSVGMIGGELTESMTSRKEETKLKEPVDNDAYEEAVTGENHCKGKGVRDGAKSSRKQVSYNGYYNRHLLRVCEDLERNATEYDRLIPFKEDYTAADWVKVHRVETLPIVSPDSHRLAKKYRHYIFGIGAGRYYLGIPGRFLVSEHPDEGESGFTLWQPILGAESLNAMEENCPEEDRRAAYGYWIVAVDRKNGNILEA